MQVYFVSTQLLTVALKEFEELIDVVHFVVVMRVLLKVMKKKRPEERQGHVEAEFVKVYDLVEQEHCVVEIVIRRLVYGLCYQMNL
jgi:hypothetical protein